MADELYDALDGQQMPTTPLVAEHELSRKVSSEV
jgi:hypothetical protein